MYRVILKKMHYVNDNYCISGVNTADNTKYTVMFRGQNAGQSHSSFESLEEFKYLGINIAYQNSIHEEIKSGLKSANASCRSVQNFFVLQLAIQKYKD